MAQPLGWMSTKKRSCGAVYVYRYLQMENDKQVEKCKTVGLVRELRSEKKAWEKAEQDGLLVFSKTLNSWSTFEQLALRFIDSGGIKYKAGGLDQKAEESAERDEGYLRRYAIPKWGERKATTISVNEVTAWYLELNQSLAWGTISKIHDAMSLTYQWAIRERIIPADPECNPFRPRKLGGVPCKCDSDYEARIATPEQVFAILSQLNKPETRVEWTLVLLHACTALRPSEAFGLKWSDLDFERNQINLRRGFSKGKVTRGKTKLAMTCVAMHPALAVFLNELRAESAYAADDDWIFASDTLHGKKPLDASMAGKSYLRPAAIAAGVIGEDEDVRWGWVNLRHSLGTWLADTVDLKTAQSALRHSKIATTAEIYAHRVAPTLVEAQGKYLERLKAAADAKETGLLTGLGSQNQSHPKPVTALF